MFFLTFLSSQPTPAMNVLVACVLSAVQKNVVSLDLALSSLATMASSTREMLRNRSFSQNTSLFCLRSMISSIIVFDQIDEVGAFSKVFFFSKKKRKIFFSNQTKNDLEISHKCSILCFCACGVE